MCGPARAPWTSSSRAARPSSTGGGPRLDIPAACTGRRHPANVDDCAHHEREAGVTDKYDAIVVGARCAGSPTAMLLARKGYRVLVVDRATFPSDTVSTHVVQPLGVGRARTVGAARRGWRRPDVRRSTPTRSTSARSRSPARQARPIRRSRTARGGRCSTSCWSTPRPRPARRFAKAFTVEEIVIEDGRVVGIKGRSKGGDGGHRARHGRRRRGRPALARGGGRPARAVQREAAAAGRRTTRYWSGLPMDGRFETYIRPHRGFAAAPTHDGLTLDGRRLAVRRSSTPTRRTSRATS